MNPVLFEPIYKERVWGGRSLERRLGRELPPGKVIGESWEVVDRPGDASPLREPVDGARTIRELIEARPEEVMGSGWDPARRFPILVKWLDCQQRLSLQVHPPAPVADELGGEPKTENWFVVESRPGAGLIAGLKRGVTRAEFEQALRENRLEECVHRFPVEEGESLLVESGRIHAIDAGNLILEIQQNSDTTYRVFDWGRTGLDGKPRELHLEQSLKSIDFDDFEPSPRPAFGDFGEAILAEPGEFRIRRVNLEEGAPLDPGPAGEPALLHLVSGQIRDEATDLGIPPGNTVLLPADRSPRFRTGARTTVLLTDRFRDS